MIWNNTYMHYFKSAYFIFVKILRLVVSTSRQIEIEIENVLRVETNFFKLSRFSRRSRSTFFFSRSRFLKSRFFSRDFDASRFLSRLSRRVEIVEICRDAVEICREISTLSRPKVSTDWEISTRKCKNPRTSRSRSRQTVEKRWKFQISTNFSISIETFRTFRTCRDKIEISRSRSRYLDRRD